MIRKVFNSPSSYLATGGGEIGTSAFCSVNWHGMAARTCKKARADVEDQEWTKHRWRACDRVELEKMRRMQRKVFPNKQEMKIPVDEPVLPCLIITLHITRWTGQLAERKI